MSDLYLIAHKVRGEPAFDIAERMVCPLCVGEGCAECDDAGYWWGIPTSGHRAYAYWHYPLNDLYNHPEEGLLCVREMVGSDECPEGWPDHYACNDRASSPKVNILALLPQGPKGPTIKRRI